MLTLSTSSFQPEGTIPEKYSKDGGNVSPALSWEGLPDQTTSLALIVDDPDAPSGLFDHWLVYGIPVEAKGLEENQPIGRELSNGARQGMNGYGELGYGGPKPPSGKHRYFFHLYALDTESDLPSGLTREELEGVIQGHIVEETQIMGWYEHREGKTNAA